MGQQKSKPKPRPRPHPNHAKNKPAVVKEVVQVVVQPEINLEKVPAWVTQDYFVDIVKANVDGFKAITNFKAYPALAAGENYATLMLRVAIDVELEGSKSEHLSFMLKIEHDSEEMKKMMKIFNVFKNENYIYSDVLPELMEIYKAAGEDVAFGAKAYTFSKDPGCDTVLLEDLRTRGYKNTSRFVGLDMEHTKFVLRKLAKFHAASAWRIDTVGPYPDAFMDITKVFGDLGTNIIAQMLTSLRPMFIECVRADKEGEQYIEATEKYFDNFSAELFRSFTINPDRFNVLNHGDCWANNIMFSYTDEGKISDVLFVDYQGPRYGSPVQDLYYFILSSTNIEFKLKEFDYLIRYYHDVLIDSLKLLKYPKKLPTLRDLYSEFFKDSCSAIMSTVITLPIVLLDPTESAKLDNLMAANEEAVNFRKLLYSNEKYRRNIQEILPWLYNRGLLEISEPLIQTDAMSADKESAVAATVTTPATTKTLNQYPDWVNENYFLDVVKENVSNSKQIKNFKVDAATNAGDNYASELLKIDIEVELEDGATQNVSYMLKIALNSEQAKAMLSKLDVFKKELTMYNEIIPNLEKFCKEHGHEVVFGPKSFKFTKDTGCDSLLMENLRPRGFKNADRLIGLDMVHSKAVLSKLAEFHAASACYAATKQRFGEIFEVGLYTPENREFFEEMGKQFYPIFNECVKAYDGAEEYLDKMTVIQKDFNNLMNIVSQVDEDKFNVLNHGDCWTNNIMFQYDATGNIENTYFIDFQISKYGTPAQDLYYFLLSSTTFELKLEKFDYFIKYYHDQLIKYLELFKYPKHIPTLRELHIDLFNNGIHGFMTASSVLSAVLLDPMENANIDSMLDPNEAGIAFKKSLYLNPRYRRHAEAIFLWLNRRGLLDFEATLAADIPAAVPDATLTPCKVPSWLDEAHFVDILSEHVDGFLKILKISTESATKGGDNYSSTILKVDVDVELEDGATKTVSYILKIPLASAEANEKFSLWNFFPKEIQIYQKYIPAFEALFKEAGSNIVFAPKSFQFKKEVSGSMILLENLQSSGFKNANRLEGLDMEHTKCVLRKMAQFHAASVKYHEMNGPYPEIFNEGLYSENLRSFMEDTQKEFKKLYCECAKDFEGSEEYIDKIPHMMDVFVDQCYELSKIDVNEFNVLNHGDSWINNIMFQYDEAGNVKETYYVDYQVCKYGSPAQDLYYFILTSTQLDIKVDQFDYFIKYYHDHLVDSLAKLKYTGNVITLKELEISLSKYGFYGMATIAGTAAVCLLDPTENAKIESFTGDTAESQNFRKELFSNTRYKAHAAVVLTWLNRRGLLEI